MSHSAGIPPKYLKYLSKYFCYFLSRLSYSNNQAVCYNKGEKNSHIVWMDKSPGGPWQGSTERREDKKYLLRSESRLRVRAIPWSKTTPCWSYRLPSCRGIACHWKPSRKFPEPIPSWRQLANISSRSAFKFQKGSWMDDLVYIDQDPEWSLDIGYKGIYYSMRRNDFCSLDAR